MAYRESDLASKDHSCDIKATKTIRLQSCPIMFPFHETLRGQQRKKKMTTRVMVHEFRAWGQKYKEVVSKKRSKNINSPKKPNT